MGLVGRSYGLMRGSKCFQGEVGWNPQASGELKGVRLKAGKGGSAPQEREGAGQCSLCPHQQQKLWALCGRGGPEDWEGGAQALVSL